MEPNYKIDEVPYDPKSEGLVSETKKIYEYNKKFHPDKQPSEVPDNIPVINIDEKRINEAELAKICKQIEANSLKKQFATKKSKKLDAKKIKKVASLVAAGSAFAIFVTITTGALDIFIKEDMKKRELDSAVAYMNETIMPEVFFNSGFNVLGTDAKGNPIYEYDRSNGIRAVNYLTEKYGFTQDSAELLVAKTLDFNEKLYPEGVTPDKYYMDKGYTEGKYMDAVLVGGVKPFTTQNRAGVISRVNEIKEEGPRNNARS